MPRSRLTTDFHCVWQMGPFSAANQLARGGSKLQESSKCLLTYGSSSSEKATVCSNTQHTYFSLWSSVWLLLPSHLAKTISKLELADIVSKHVIRWVQLELLIEVFWYNVSKHPCLLLELYLGTSWSHKEMLTEKTTPLAIVPVYGNMFMVNTPVVFTGS